MNVSKLAHPWYRSILKFPAKLQLFTRKKLNFAKFCGLPYSIFWRNSVFCSVFRFYVEKIKFREISYTSVFRFFAEFRILFRIPFLRGKNQIPRNFAEFRGIPYSVFRVPYLFRIFPQNSAKNTKRKRRNSVRNSAEFFKNFDGIYFRTELNLDFRYNTKHRW